MRVLASAAGAFEEARRVFDRALAETRGQWDDATRRSFDREFSEVLLFEAKRTATELQNLAQEADAALAALDSLRWHFDR